MLDRMDRSSRIFMLNTSIKLLFKSRWPGHAEDGLGGISLLDEYKDRFTAVFYIIIIPLEH